MDISFETYCFLDKTMLGVPTRCLSQFRQKYQKSDWVGIFFGHLKDEIEILSSIYLLILQVQDFLEQILLWKPE